MAIFLPQSWANFHARERLVLTERGLAELAYPDLWRRAIFAHTGKMGQTLVNLADRSRASGTLSGSDVSWSGNYLEFGNSATNSYAQWLLSGLVHASCSFSVWFKPTSGAAESRIFGLMSGSDQFLETQTSTPLTTSFSFHNLTGTDASTTITSVINQDEWNHATVTCGSATLTTYCNGQSDTDTGTGSEGVTVDRVIIGNRISNPNRQWDGQIGAAMVWNRVLTQAEADWIHGNPQEEPFKVRAMPKVFFVPTATTGPSLLPLMGVG